MTAVEVPRPWLVLGANGTHSDSVPFSSPVTSPACQNATSPTASVDELIAAATAELAAGRADEALELCQQALSRVPAAGEPTRAFGAVVRLTARAHLQRGDAAAALDALDAALAVAEVAEDELGAAHALNATAIVHFQRGQLDDASRLYEAARACARRGGDRALVAHTALNLGIVANIHGDVSRALSHYRRAAVDYRGLGMRANEARAYNNIGQAYADLGQWDRAEAAYGAAADIFRALDDLGGLGGVLGNLAEVWVGRGDLARARVICDEALEVCERTPHAPALGEAYRLTGVIARETGAFDAAELHFAAAERVAREREDLLLLAETVREQGDLYRRQSRNRETLTALNRSHRLFAQLRARRDLADIGRRMSRLEDDFVAVARRWGESIEAADRYTQGHCQRVADLACLIAERAGPDHGFDAQAMFWFRIGALLHDVGKLGIPAEVLNKPGKLTDDEFALMRSHTTAGVDMLADVEFPWDIRPIVLSHHERWDGRGYPHRLAGDAIPLTARILCVADVYDALTSVRSYKRALTHDEAMDLLRRDCGTAFDPRVFAWFEAVAPAWAETRGVTAADSAAAGADQDACRQRLALGLDPLTGLPGRDAFYRECELVLAARRADGRPTGLVLVRVANATVVGATRGRAALEAGLAAVADALSRNTRGGDFVGRYADDEFVVLLPDEDLRHTHAAANRLRECAAAVRVLAPSKPGAPPGALALAIHVGVASGTQPATTAAGLLAAADAALGRTGAGRLAA